MLAHEVLPGRRKEYSRSLIFLAAALVLTGLLLGCQQDAERAVDAIHPSQEYPRYWHYQGEPVLLIGGSKDDNLFQIPNLADHLDSLAVVGGNYIRNTMSARPDKGFEIHAFDTTTNGRYDLNAWNPEYWRRFERMLEWTEERDIIVQIELWDQWDLNRGLWAQSPWNPQNNINYDTSEVMLAESGNYEKVVHDTDIPHDFYLTVPGAQHDPRVLKYQRRFIRKMLDYSLAHGNVLYTITNELFSQHPAAWSEYWIDFIHERARSQGREVYATEMFLSTDIRAGRHKRTLANPNQYDYVELSQNNQNNGESHWDQLQWAYWYLESEPRPINNVKIYGGVVPWTGGPDAGIDRFWRNIIGGAASARFHRPKSGNGLNDRAKQHIRSSRMLSQKVDLMAAQPDSSHRLLRDRDPNEAYLTRTTGLRYVVYFPDGGAVELDLSDTRRVLELVWLNAEESEWSKTREIRGDKPVPLETPKPGDWVAVITRR